jgi:phosphopantetheinyl transferase
MILPIGVTIRYARLDGALEARVEEARAWLGATERQELANLRDAGRRRQWLAGRWLAKQVIGEAFNIDDPAQIDILTRDHRGRGVRPRVLTRLHDLQLSLSISHTELGVLAALSKSNRLSVGVDLVPRLLPAQDGFQGLWFTPRERQWVEHDPQGRTAVLWAVKEAVYKAINKGQSWNPRHIEVRRQGRSEFECSYRGRRLSGLSISLDQFDGQTAAVACLRWVVTSGRTAAASQPEPLRISRPAVQKSEQRPRFIVCGY